VQLQDFFDYKNQLMGDLLTNKEIVRLLDVDGVTADNAEELAYSRVFPYEFLPETVEDGHTFICFDVDISRVNGKTFLSPTLYIWVFTHKSKMRLDEGGVRVDRLCSEICKQINGSRKYGLGELNIYACRRFAPMTDFHGKMLTFSVREFNRVYDGAKEVPGNRKYEV